MAAHHSTCFTVLLLSLCLAGCGGTVNNQNSPTTPTPSAPAAITSTQVFQNIAQTWNFTDDFGHHMTIAPRPIACAFGTCGDISVWHYTKDSCAGYWNTRTPEQCAVATTLDELYFVLRHDADGAWRCIGFTDVDYLGNKWKVQINPWLGQALPYTIVPVSSAVSDPNTGYDGIVKALAFDADLTDFSPITGSTSYSATWRTDASAEGNGLISFQHEGCVTEKWTFADGLEKVIPVVGLGNSGVCLTLDTRLTMTRDH